MPTIRSGSRQANKYCFRCRKQVLATGRAPSHGLHATIAVLTCGMWLLPWLAIALSNPAKWRCSECGRKI